MKVYRGPDSKPFIDDAHKFVSRVSPSQLRKGIEDNALIRFRVTKNATERHAVCTARFEDDDIIPMIAGLLSRLEARQSCLGKIKGVMNEDIGAAEKLKAIRLALQEI